MTCVTTTHQSIGDTSHIPQVGDALPIIYTGNCKSLVTDLRGEVALHRQVQLFQGVQSWMKKQLLLLRYISSIWGGWRLNLVKMSITSNQTQKYQKIEVAYTLPVLEWSSKLAEAFPQPLFRLTPGNTVLPRVGFFVSLTATSVTRCYPVVIETRF